MAPREHKFTPKQQQYLASTARFLLYGGGAGGGKTHVAIYDKLGLNNPGPEVDPERPRAIDHPEYKGLFLRKTLPMIRDVIGRTKQLYPEIGKCFRTGKAPRWYAQDKKWVFPSGAEILFGYVDRPDDVENYQGWEYQSITFEELTQWPTPGEFLYLHTRLRKKDDNPIRLGMRATCNPGGVGHQWVRSFWNIDDAGNPTNFVVPIEVCINGVTEMVNYQRQFIPALLDENPFLSQAEYAAALSDTALSENLRRALRFGRWDVVDLKGVIYADQMQMIHNRGHVREVPYDPRFPVNCFWDVGTTDHTAIWFHQRINENDYFIDYYEAKNRGIGDHWRELKARPYNYGVHFVPHDVRQRRHASAGTIATIEDIMRDVGMRNLHTVPKVPLLQQGIEKTRIVLPRCYFDGIHCARGLECLTNYRFPIGADGALGSRPVHDEYSHGADAFRQYAQSYEHIDDAIFMRSDGPEVMLDPSEHYIREAEEPTRRRKWRV